MKKFGFKIQTRGGSIVENLVIQGRDRDEAERKLRQVYHHCTIVEEKVLADPIPEDASQLEGVLTLISSEVDAASAAQPLDAKEAPKP